MPSEDLTIRIVARQLRRKFEGRVSPVIVERLTDEQLVAKFRENTARKIEHLKSKQEGDRR